MQPVHVFVYGTLKKDRSNHRVMGDSKFCFDHVTEPKYTMVTNGGFPIVKRDGSTAITGEVYEVTNPDTLRRIYNLEGYTGTPGASGNWYDVDEVPINKQITANMFVMDADKYNELRVIPSGIF